VKLRFDNFQIVTRAITLAAYTADAAVIRRSAGLCLRRAPLERRLRLLGVRVGGLIKLDGASGLDASPPGTLDLF